ncbi:hypothetical protein K2Z83_27700 [Oscillochloris sp. ZM17-4]|uniref:hypothetical protein n=1 Tax=Oscillochloris sp. ZM17-4 TaxID=2866714 RepID=UPI001C73DAA8|nr:hypothetical protein [Oscillochloris sp. ZM17-4]MBX0331442.1 hypothetical protein [Oscillochloris sp. ZM17-4]
MKDAKQPAPHTSLAARRGRPPGDRSTFGRLRITVDERDQAGAIQPLYPEVDNDSDLAYRIWRRGLQIDLARLVSLGGTIPAGMTEEALAMLIAQDLLHCLPLLRRTGVLATLQIEVSDGSTGLPPVDNAVEDEIADDAADSIQGLGGTDFL